jgi:hypothetical protein
VDGIDRRHFLTAGAAALVGCALPDTAEAAPTTATLTKRLKAAEKSRDSYRLKYLKLKPKWSKADVEWVTRRALRDYDIPAREHAWVVAAAVRVATRESGRRPKARNGQHLGMMQFNSGWKGGDKRLDGKWSVYRFVRVYRDGGKAAIRRHWKATI